MHVPLRPSQVFLVVLIAYLPKFACYEDSGSDCVRLR